MRKVKIVCTMGPSTASVDRLVEMIEAGMDVARINFSHGEYQGHREMFEMVREAARRTGKPVGILGDLCGPKIRVGKMTGGKVPLVPGAVVRLCTEDILGTPERIPHTYLPLAQDVKPGDPVLLNDGLFRLRVEAVEGRDVVCRVEAGGMLSDRKGMNLPGTRTSMPAITDKDRRDLEFAVGLKFDYLALSFVRSAQDVLEAKGLAQGIPVLAKIEKPEAIDDLEAILDAADGVMVARGDLGVEMGHEKVPLLQKKIIAGVRPRFKPVITATQMLESMTESATPTRAEASDVANAVLDGTDAVMLSGETSVGKHPVLVVQTMARIIDEIERSDYFEDRNRLRPVMRSFSYSSMVAEAVCAASRDYDLAALAVYSESGTSAALVSAERPRPPILAFTRHDSVRNRLALFWGVRPAHGEWVKGVEGVVEQAERVLLEQGLVAPGQDIAVTFGMRLGDEPFQTNMMKLWKVRDDRSRPLATNRAVPAP